LAKLWQKNKVAPFFPDTVYINDTVQLCVFWTFTLENLHTPE